jgi:hypothetical protein
VTQLLSQGDLLALIDRAAPVVGEIEEPTDPIAPGMLFTDARMLLDQIALRTAGMPVGALVRWQARHGWKRGRRRSAPHERQQLEMAQARSREAVQRRADAFAAIVLPIIREIQASGARTSGAIARELNLRGVRPAQTISWHRTSVEKFLRRVEARLGCGGP